MAVNNSRAAAQGNSRIGEKPETDGKKKKLSGKAVAVIIVVILIAGLGAMYYFNLLGVKTKVVSFFVSQDTQYEMMLSEKAAYEQGKQELEQKQQELTAREKQLNEREAALETQEAAKGGATQGASGKEVASVFENMDKSAAAGIFNNVASDQWIAGVLSAMDQKKAAEILGAMESAKAGAVAQQMNQ